MAKENMATFIQERAVIENKQAKKALIRETLNRGITKKRTYMPKKKKSYTESLNDIKRHLLEGVYADLYHSIMHIPGVSDFGMMMGDSLLASYIEESGADNIIRNIEINPNKTIFMAEMVRHYRDTIRKITEDMDPDNDETFVVDPGVEKEFYDNLSDSDDMEQLTDAIRRRVVDAEERLRIDSIDDKIKTDDVVAKAAERIQKVQDSDNEFNKNECVEDITQRTNAAVNNITSRRHRGVLEQIMRNLGEKAMVDAELSEAFCDCDNMNYDKLLEASMCLYGVGEMLCSLGLERFDEKSVLEFVTF